MIKVFKNPDKKDDGENLYLIVPDRQNLTAFLSLLSLDFGACYSWSRLNSHFTLTVWRVKYLDNEYQDWTPDKIAEYLGVTA